MAWESRIVGHGEAAPADLVGNPRNWRTHPKAQRDALAGVLDQVGWVQDVIVNRRTGYLVDGHARVAVAEQRGEASVPVVYVDLSEDEELLILATLDPLAAMAEADTEVLADLLAAITSEDAALTSMLDALAKAEGIDTAVEGLTDPDDVPQPPDEPYVQRGEVYQLGRHRLMCGDSTDAGDVARLLDGAVAQLLHADPPYGMGKEADGVTGDNQYGDKLDAFQMSWWRAYRLHLADNGSAYIWGNAEELWRLWYRGGLRDSERMTFRNEIVWEKGSTRGQLSPDFRSYAPETERCLFFMLGEQGFNINADNYWEGWEPIRSALASDCDKMGWGPKDIERICGVGNFSHWFTKSQWGFIPEEHYRKLQDAARDHDAFKRDHDAFKRDHDDLKRDHDDLKREFYATRAYFDNTHDNMTDAWHFQRVTGDERHGHATPKPVEMIERAIKSSTNDGGLVVEPFSGSGTTLIAAERQGRTCYAMEIEPKYVQVCIDRWEAFTGQKAERV